MKPKFLMLVFTFKRDLQLSALLESFYLHLRPAIVPRAVFYSEDCKKLRKGEFKQDVLNILDGWDYVLFCVDDTIFIRDFSLGDVTQALEQNESAIGFSLRLGRNTTYCYTRDKKQAIPPFRPIGKGINSYKWFGRLRDFGYPLEISSSVYRVADIIPILEVSEFDNPTRLEVALDQGKKIPKKPNLLCYEQSVAFSAPFNKVQAEFDNRAMDYTVEDFDALYRAGKRIEVGRYSDFETNAAHQEVKLYLRGQDEKNK